MDFIDVDVIVMSYHSANYIKALRESLIKQRLIRVRNFIVPLVLDKNKKNDEVKKYCDDNNIQTFEIESWYFSQLLTRQRVIKHYCTSNIVVSFGNDCLPINDVAVYNLVKDIKNGQCAYAYGRQVSTKHGVERYVKEKVFDIRPYFVDHAFFLENKSRALFSDDSFSALDRNIFIAINGFQGYGDYQLSDVLYSYIILKNGYKKKYAGDAVASSQYDLNNKQVKERYFNTGVIYAQLPDLDGVKYYTKDLKLTRYVLKRSLKDFNLVVFFSTIPNMLMRKRSFSKGRRVAKRAN